MRREDVLYDLALIYVEQAELSLKDKQERLDQALKQKECAKHEFEMFKSMFHNADMETEKCKFCGYINAERKQNG